MRIFDMRKGKWFNYIWYALLIIIVNSISYSWDLRWDLTPDKRYSLSQESKDFLKQSDGELVITVLLEGRLPASFRSYRDYIDFTLGELRRYKPGLAIKYRDPGEGSAEESNAFRAFLNDNGIRPISRRAANREEISQTLIYPFISVHNQNAIQFIDLLDSKARGETEQEAILRAMVTLESKLIRAIRNIQSGQPDRIGVLGERHEEVAGMLNTSGGRIYSSIFIPGISRLNTDSLDALVVLLREKDLSRDELLFVDQALQDGIPVIWAIDKFNVSVDSVGRYGRYVAIPNVFQAEDMLFRLGARISADLFMDLKCTRIPQVVGTAGGQPQTVLLEYPFHPLIEGKEDHPVSRGLQPLSAYFVQPIDTIRSAFEVEKKVLLTSSLYTRALSAPVQLDFEFMRVEPNPAEYRGGEKIFAVLLEGRAPSYFLNRVSAEEREWLVSKGIRSIQSGDSVFVQIVVGDTDFLIPMKDPSGNLLSIGYNKWDRTLYDGNLSWFFNALEYAVHGEALLNISRDELGVGILNTAKFNTYKSWYYFNLFGIPLLIIALFLGIFFFYRKVRYEWELGRK